MEIKSVNTTFKAVIDAVTANFTAAGNAYYYHGLTPEGRKELNDLYNANFPTDILPPGICKSCQNWLLVYGDLVWFDTDSNVHTLWEPSAVINTHYYELFKLMDDYIRDNLCNIGTPVIPSTHVVGQPTTNQYNHLYLKFNYSDVSEARDVANRYLTMLSYCFTRINFIKRMRVVVEFLRNQNRTEHIDKSIATLDSLLAIVEPVADQEDFYKFVYGNAHRLSPSHCSVMNGAINILLTDYRDLDNVSQSEFYAYLHATDPANYMRVSRAFSDIQIKQAEKLMAETGIDKALQRRCVQKGEDIGAMWTNPVKPVANGLLSSVLESKNKPATVVNPKRKISLSAYAFINKYLPDITDLFMVVGYNPEPYSGLTTAINPDVPELFKHDGHLSIWTYTKGSYPSQWHLSVGQVVRVSAIATDLIIKDSLLLLLEEGYHEDESPLCIWKQLLSSNKINTKLLADPLSAYNEKVKIPKDVNAVVAYAINKNNFNLNLKLNASLSDGSQVEFTITSWE